MDAAETNALDVAAAAWESCHERNCASSDRVAVRRLAVRAAIVAYEKETGERRKALVDALTLLVDNGSWYVRCLRDVIARTPVRALDEALSGYAHALEQARQLLALPIIEVVDDVVRERIREQPPYDIGEDPS